MVVSAAGSLGVNALVFSLVTACSSTRYTSNRKYVIMNHIGNYVPVLVAADIYAHLRLHKSIRLMFMHI